MIRQNYHILWTRAVLKNEMSYPCEYVIRIFKGAYPRLNFDKAKFRGKKICDVGFGDGRNFGLFKRCGFKLYGVEVNKEIVDKAADNLSSIGVKADLRVGLNDSIPYPVRYFDYLLSWNACYYMGERINFTLHVKEFARVMKKNAYLVISIPQKTCFIYRGSETFKKGYQIIRNDPFGLRNGDILKMFEDEADIQKEFSPYFKNFTFATIHDDCFGLQYHWHLVVCQKK